MFGGEIEVNQSYFGCKRKVRRGRGSQAHIPLFSPLKRGGKVYTKIIADASSCYINPNH